MAVDLVILGSLISRRSLVVDDEALIILEHESSKDRVRRILFDRIESIVSWRVTPWGRLAVMGTCFLILASSAVMIAISANGSPDVVPILIPLGVVSVVFVPILLRLLICGKTFIRVTRAGQEQDFAVIARRRKLQRFFEKVQAGVVEAQRLAAERLAERRAAPEPEDIPVATLLDEPPEAPAPPGVSPPLAAPESPAP